MQRLLKRLGVIGQLGVGRDDDVADEVLQHLAEIGLLRLGELGAANDGISSFELADDISTTIYSTLTKRFYCIIGSSRVLTVIILINKWCCLSYIELSFLVVLVVILAA